MKPRLDDVVSVAVVSAVAAIFLAETIALWPEPMRFKDFSLLKIHSQVLPNSLTVLRVLASSSEAVRTVQNLRLDKANPLLDEFLLQLSCYDIGRYAHVSNTISQFGIGSVVRTNPNGIGAPFSASCHLCNAG